MMVVCMEKIKIQPWWKPFKKFIKFVFHFIVVMLLLGLGAFAFARIEDPPSQSKEILVKSNTKTVLFWKYLIERYDIRIDDASKDNFTKDILKHQRKIDEEMKELVRTELLKNRWLVFKKWFYFVTVATTTIGYGDIYPTTDLGKIFYTAFSIIGIPLMMTLLASCGDIMTAVNKSFFGVINRCLCNKRKLVSEELLSSLSIFIIFVGYLSIGCIYLAYYLKWSLIDSIYFWVVTFTTVGFGDMYIPFEEQDDTIIGILIIYRIFGLALLAGLIDSLVAWVNVRKRNIQETAKFLKDKKKNYLANDLFFKKDSLQDGNATEDEDGFLTIKENLELNNNPTTL